MGPLLGLLGYPRAGGLKAIRRAILDVMGPGGLLLWPVFPTTAPKHGFAWTTKGLPFYTGVFNALGFPAVAVPAGMSNDGLPLSVQIVARPGEDETALAAAEIIEKAWGGWRMAPLTG
jgi:fatty acid amide hydrolase 2